MTYTYKLGRRLARLRVPAAILIAALPALGCNTGGELKEGFGPGPGDQLPTATANGPYSGTAGSAIAFSSAGSFDPEGAWTGTWDFGDGATTTGANPSHSYSTAGSYTATLTVTDQVGQTATDNATVTITDSLPLDQPPTANANGPYGGGTGSSIAFSSAGSFDPEGAWTASWDFGDGATATGPNPSHSYTSAGSYTATLTVTDQAGQTASDNAAVTITTAPPPPPPTGAYPNEPAGYTRFFEYDFTAPLLHGIANSNGQEIDGCIWKWDPGGGGLVNPISDAGAGQSPPNVLRYRYPNGLTGGVSAGLMHMWDCPAAETTGTEYRETYESFWFNIVGAGDGTYENNPVGTKIFGYWGVGENNQSVFPTSHYFLLDGDGATSINSSFNFSFIQQSFADRRMFPNVNPGFRIDAGTWYQFEIVQILSGIDQNNGILKIWLNGTLVMDYNDVLFRTSGSPSGFWGRHMRPVWGGGPGLKTRDDDVYWDHVYMSGKQ